MQFEQIYFRENINSGGHGKLYYSEDESYLLSLEWAQKLAIQVLKVHQQIFLSSNGTNPTKMTWKQLYDAIPLCDLSQPELDSGMIEGIHANRIKSGGARHIPQLASLVGHLRKLDVLPSLGAPLSVAKRVILLEMGAGRGVFGLTAAGVSAANNSSTRLIMVERTGSRSKADKIFRTLPSATPEGTKPYLKLDTVEWSRIECDLAHVNLPVALRDESCAKDDETKIVVIAKHLCGAGTDLALKSMEPIRERVHACLLATCCHGLCNWNDYVGRDYLRKAMLVDGIPFGPREFDLMRQWCAGSVACQNNKIHEKDEDTRLESTTEHEEPEHSTSRKITEASALNISNRVNISAVVDSLQLECGIEGLGRACQRLIDFGRREYVREFLFNPTTAICDLVHYVPSDVSPQNACLIGRCR